MSSLGKSGFKYFASFAAISGFTYVGLEVYRPQKENGAQSIALSSEDRKLALEWRPPLRSQLIQRLKDDDFDLVVIGGGATGTGCALDGASRGLKVALVERDDFSSGTSSKSTKLVHGGVRYLEKAFLRLDWGQFQMVREALHERATFLKIAPHLTSQLPIMLPIYKWFMVPYYWAGSKMYDLVAGSKGLEQSYFLSRSKALEAFPMLRRDKLVGAMVYYDGEQNDARTNVALALTALQQGATVTNYTEVTELIKNELGTITGVIVKDRLSQENFPIKCKGVISATGPFCGSQDYRVNSCLHLCLDIIRKLDDPRCESIVQPSTGTHVVLPSYYSPLRMGLVDPSSSDGRVIFFLPWEGNTVAGTTDSPATVTFEPKATNKEINFIVDEVRRYLDPEIQVRKSDVLAAWSGLRPLVKDPSRASTQELVRNHIVIVSPSGLMTIAGGKWTTYRKMAEETIDAAISRFKLSPKLPKSPTEHILLIGAHGYEENGYIKLIQQFGLETDVALHLSRNYGDRSAVVAAMAESSGRRWPLYGKRLVPHYPFLEAEVRYAVRFEYAATAVDILARRTRLAFLSCQAAQDALPKVIEIMGEELGWSSTERKRQNMLALDYLCTCGISDLHPVRAEFARQHLDAYKDEFSRLTGRDPLWPRISYEAAIEGWRELAKLEAINGDSSIDWSKIIKSADKHAVGSIGIKEFLDGISLIKSTYPNGNGSGNHQQPVQHPDTERNSWSL